MVELLGQRTPQFTALYYEIDPVIDRVMAEITYTDSSGKEGTSTVTAPVGRP